MKTLRLILTYDCPRNCPGCCNKQGPFRPENVVKWNGRLDRYNMVIITGGEPLMYPFTLLEHATHMKRERPDLKLVLYTAKIDEPDVIENMLNYFDGITITIHNQADVDDFRRLNFQLLRRKRWIQDNNKSLRLNVFEGIDLLTVNDSLWKIKKDIVWIPDCPLPGHEVIRRM